MNFKICIGQVYRYIDFASICHANVQLYILVVFNHLFVICIYVDSSA